MRQSRTDLVRIGVQEESGHPGLDVDEGQVVADAVMQVMSDPEPLLGDAPAGLLLPGALRLLADALRAPRAPFDLGEIAAPVTGGDADGQRHPAQRRQSQVV